MSGAGLDLRVLKVGSSSKRPKSIKNRSLHFPTPAKSLLAGVQGKERKITSSIHQSKQPSVHPMLIGCLVYTRQVQGARHTIVKGNVAPAFMELIV